MSIKITMSFNIEYDKDDEDEIFNSIKNNKEDLSEFLCQDASNAWCEYIEDAIECDNIKIEKI